MWATRLQYVVFFMVAFEIGAVLPLHAAQPANTQTAPAISAVPAQIPANQPTQAGQPTTIPVVTTPSVAQPSMQNRQTPVASPASTAPTTAPAPQQTASQAAVAQPQPTASASAVAETAQPITPPSEVKVEGSAANQAAQAEMPQVPLAAASEVTGLPIPAEEKAAPIPSAPALEPVKTPQEEALGEEANIIGIDTVELQDAQGNWLFKRLWWERAEDKYEKIRKQVASIMESRGQFFEKRTDAEKDIFDKLYQEIGFERGELDELINRLIDRMNRLREREGTLDEKEREFYAQLQAEKKSLDVIKANVNTIYALEGSIDEVVSRLMETINKVRQYEQDAWQNFKDIARVLDDRKAKEMFYKIDAIWRNVTSLKEYIETRLSSHFDQLLAKSTQETNRVAQSLAELKEKGLDLQKQEEAILQYERDKEAARIKAIETARRQAEEAAKEEEKAEEGFFTSYIWNPIKAVITWPYYAIFGESEEEDSEENETTPARKTQESSAKSGKESAPVAEQKKQSLPESQNSQEQEAETEEDKGFLENYILDPLKYIWDKVIYLVTWPYYALVGTTEEEAGAAVVKPTTAVQQSQESSKVQEVQPAQAETNPAQQIAKEPVVPAEQKNESPAVQQPQLEQSVPAESATVTPAPASEQQQLVIEIPTSASQAAAQ